MAATSIRLSLHCEMCSSPSRSHPATRRKQPKSRTPVTRPCTTASTDGPDDLRSARRSFRRSASDRPERIMSGERDRDRLGLRGWLCTRSRGAGLGLRLGARFLRKERAAAGRSGRKSTSSVATGADAACCSRASSSCSTSCILPPITENARTSGSRGIPSDPSDLRSLYTPGALPGSV